MLQFNASTINSIQSSAKFGLGPISDLDLFWQMTQLLPRLWPYDVGLNLAISICPNSAGLWEIRVVLRIYGAVRYGLTMSVLPELFGDRALAQSDAN